jgi:phospholipase D-like protein
MSEDIVAAILGIGGVWLLFVFGMLAAAVVFWLWMMIDVLTRQREDKIVWLLAVFFLNLLGAFVYYFVARKKRLVTA